MIQNEVSLGGSPTINGTLIMTKIFIISIMIMLGLPVTVDDVEVDAVVGQPARLAAVVAQPAFGFVFVVA